MNLSWLKRPNIPKIAFTVCIWIFLLSGCASSIEKASIRLEKLEAQIEQTTLGEHSKSFDLHDLLRWVHHSSLQAAKVDISDIINIADIEQADSQIVPSISITPTYGITPFVLRDDPGNKFKITSAANWDFLRYFESQKRKELLLRNSDAIKLKKSLVKKQVDLEVVRLYLDYTQNLRLLSVAEKRNHVEENKVKMLRMRATINAEDRTELEKLTTSTHVDTQRLNVIIARTEWLKQQLLHLCRLPNHVEIVANDTIPSTEIQVESFGDYLKAAIEQSEDYGMAQISSEISVEKIKLTKLNRWTKFSFSSSLMNLLNSVSSPPFFLISWTFDLFDRGDFDRQMLRSRADALLAKLDVYDQQIKTIQLAGAAWTSLMDKSAEYYSETKEYRETQLDFLVAQQLLKSGTLSTEEFQEPQIKFIEKTNMLLGKKGAMILAKAQYLSLISDDSDNWINRL